MKSIKCCIVDDHCDIIPFLFSCWKAKKIELNNNIFIHFDSHPDLIPPNSLSIKDYCNQQKIYETLEQEGGISEFILPLFINNHINKVIWIHQFWCLQFLEDGNKSYFIGDNQDGIASVSLKESYYFDEGLVFLSEELQFKKQIEFFTYTNTNVELFSDISSPPPPSSSLSSVEITTTPISWILDICLDYFTVSNPFFLQLESHLEGLISTFSVQDIYQSIQLMFTNIRFRSCDDTSEINLSDRRTERTLFLSLISEILTSSTFPSLESTCCIQFLTLFDSSKQNYAESFLRIISTLPPSIRMVIFEAGKV